MALDEDKTDFVPAQAEVYTSSWALAAEIWSSSVAMQHLCLSRDGRAGTQDGNNFHCCATFRAGSSSLLPG